MSRKSPFIITIFCLLHTFVSALILLNYLSANFIFHLLLSDSQFFLSCFIYKFYSYITVFLFLHGFYNSPLGSRLRAKCGGRPSGKPLSGAVSLTPIRSH